MQAPRPHGDLHKPNKFCGITDPTIIAQSAKPVIPIQIFQTAKPKNYSLATLVALPAKPHQKATKAADQRGVLQFVIQRFLLPPQYLNDLKVADLLFR